MDEDPGGRPLAPAQIYGATPLLTRVLARDWPTQPGTIFPSFRKRATGVKAV